MTHQGLCVVNDWQVYCRTSAQYYAGNSVWSRDVVQESGRLSVGSCAVFYSRADADPCIDKPELRISSTAGMSL